MNDYYEADKEIGYVHKKNVPPTFREFRENNYTIFTNEYRCYDKDIINSNEQYILLIGDSSTWGHAKYDKRFSDVLEKLIGIKILNCGVIGYGSIQSFIFAKRVIQAIGHKPSLIIYNYFIGNDFIDDYLFPKYTVVNNHWVNFKRIKNELNGEILEKTTAELYDEHFSEHYIGDENNKKIINEFVNFIFHRDIDHFLNRNSIIYAMSKKFYKNISTRNENTNQFISLKWEPWVIRDFNLYPWLKTAFKKNLDQIKKFNDQLNNEKIPFLINILPDKWQIHNEILMDEYSNRDLFYLNNKAINFFLKNKIKNHDLSIDLINFKNENNSTMLKSNRLYYILDGHWNELGQKISANSTFNFILENFEIN